MLADSVTEERIAQVEFATGSGALNTASVGELAEVTLELPQTALALLLPNAAIQRIKGQVGVWRMGGNTLEFVPVRLGASDLNGQVQILEGLKAGDSVVVYSQKALTAQTRIKVVDALAPSAEKASSP
jgi:HlyD family secretion protein